MFGRGKKDEAPSPRVTARITGINYSAEAQDEHSDTLVVVRLRVEWMYPDHQVGGFKVNVAHLTSHFGNADLAQHVPPRYRLGALVEVALTDKGPVDLSGYAQPVRRVPDGGLSGLGSGKSALEHLDVLGETAGAIGAAAARLVGRQDANWGPPEWVTVVSWEPARMRSWNITLRRADGSLAVAERSRVPGYAQCYVVPNGYVLASINPKNPGEAAIDWVALAIERATADAAGHVDDPVPAGSIALDMRSGGGIAGSNAALTAQLEATRAAALDTADAIEGVTFERHVKIDQFLMTFRVGPNEHDEFAAIEFGVAPGRYTAIAQQWQQRMPSDERLREAFGDLMDTYQPLAMQAAQADQWTWQRRGDLDRQ